MARPTIDVNKLEHASSDVISGGQNNKIEPTSTVKANGYAFLEKPPFNFFNYWFNLAYQYLKWVVEEALEGTFTFDGVKTFSGAITFGSTITTTGIITANGTLTVNDTTDSTSKDTGAVILASGGLGVEGNIYNGGNVVSGGTITSTGIIYGNDTTDSTSKDTGAIITEGGIGVEKNITAGGTIQGVGGEVIEYRTSAGSETTAIIKKKIVEIGDWNMYITGGGSGATSKNVTHNISDYTKIRKISCVVRDDGGGSAAFYDLNRFNNTADPGLLGGGIIQTTSTYIRPGIRTGGIFDTTSFQATSYNRGWIFIEYEV